MTTWYRIIIYLLKVALVGHCQKSGCKISPKLDKNPDSTGGHENEFSGWQSMHEYLQHRRYL